MNKSPPIHSLLSPTFPRGITYYITYKVSRYSESPCNNVHSFFVLGCSNYLQCFSYHFNVNSAIVTG